MFDFFSPRVFFPVSALFFLLAGIIGAGFFPQFQIPFVVVLLHFLGIAIFLAGTFSAGRLEKVFGNQWIVLSVFSVLLLYFSYLNFRSYYYLALLAPVVLYCLRKYCEKLGYPLVLAGALLFLANLRSVGIPLLNPALRDGGYTFVWAFSILLFLLGFGLRLQVAGKREIFLLSLFGAVLLALGGYRGPIILLVVSALACAHHRKLLDFKKIVPFFILLLLFVGIMGWFVAKPVVDPVQLLFFRASYTNWIEGAILTDSPLWGFKGGKMWFEPNPRFSIGETFAGKHRSITGGFFGSLWFDSGIAGFVLGSFLAGAMLQTIYIKRKLAPAIYWLALAYLTLSIETGLDFVYLAVFLASVFFVSRRL